MAWGAALLGADSAAGYSASDTPYFGFKTFTDNIVVGYPLRRLGREPGEAELGHVLDALSALQMELSEGGFFLRGGIAFGNHYMDDDFVFGDALLNAVALDKQGGPPQITLDVGTAELVRNYLTYYGRSDQAPEWEFLLEDKDEVMFLNYLALAFEAWPDALFTEIFEKHAENVKRELSSAADGAIRRKYEWVARYHNFICRDWATRHPIPFGDSEGGGYDEEYAAAAIESQKLLDYIIDVPDGPQPRRIAPEPQASAD